MRKYHLDWERVREGLFDKVTFKLRLERWVEPVRSGVGKAF